MRTNKETKRKAIRKIAGLMILVLCFALTFTLVLTLGVNGDLNLDNPSLAPVADAASVNFGTSAKTDEAASKLPAGTANPISVSPFATQTGADVFTLTNAQKADSTQTSALTATKWKYDVDLKSVAPAATSSGSTNFQVQKNGGENQHYANVGTANHWEVGISDVISARTAGFCLTYKLPDFIATLVDNTNFTVTATVSFVYVGRYHGDSPAWGNIEGTLYYHAQQCKSSSIPTADKYVTAGQKYTSANKDSANASLTCTTFTMSKGNDCISFGLGWGATSRVGITGTQRGIIFKDIAISFTITLDTSTTSTSTTSINDYSAPVKVATTLNGKDGTGYENYTPFITNVASMPVYYEAIATRLNNYTDQKNSATKTTLRSFTSQMRTATIGSDGKAIEYYKYSYMEYADTFDYSTLGFDTSKLSTSNYFAYAGVGGYTTSNSGTSWTTDTTRTLQMVSGIKNVTFQVGTTVTTITVNALSNNTESVATDIKNGTTVVGYATVKKLNKARVDIKIYMKQSYSVITKVTDNGDKTSAAQTTDFQGIDTTAPTVSPTLSYTPAQEGEKSYITTAYSLLTGTSTSWFRDSVFKPTISGAQSTSGAPFIWFYTVQRSDNASDLSTAPTIDGYGKWKYSSTKDYSTGTWNLIKTMGMKPIGYDTLSSFEYNFATGAAKALGDASNTYTATNPSIITDDVTGSGYYRFNFYTVDLAGNLGTSVLSRYVKVDYDNPSYDIDFSYVVRTADGSNTYTINAADNGTKWSVGDTTFALTFDKLNFSGNTLIINGKNELTYSIAFNKDGITNVNGSAVTASDDATFTIESRIDDTSVHVTLTVEPWTDTLNRTRYRGVLTFKFDEDVVGTYPTVAIESPLSTYPGEFASNLTASSNQDAAKHVFTNASWNDMVNIYIDRNAPVAPVLDGGEYLITGTNNYNINIANRKWFTSGYELPSKLEFYDDLWNVDSDYASGIKIYSGFKYISTQDDFDALKALEIEKNYKTITSATGWFNMLKDANVVSFSSKTDISFPLEFDTVMGSGMRVVYVWAVDQAGNASPLSTYYVLVDANSYNIVSNIFDNPIIGKNGTISIINDKNNSISNTKRGETINIKFTLDLGYVPYTLKKNADTIFENYSPSGKMNVVADSPFKDLLPKTVTASENSYTIPFVFDDLNSLGAIDSTTNFELTVRQVISRSYTSANLQKAYDAQPIDMLQYILFNDDNAASHYKFDFEKVEEGKDNVALDAAPTSKGNYKVYVYLEKDDSAYVDTTYAQDSNGVQIKPSVGFTIRQGRVVITVVSTESVYGDNISIKYTIAGFDFDEENPAPTGEYIGGSFTLIVNGNKISSDNLNTLIPVGTYDIVENLPFTIYDRNGQVSENYEQIVITDNSPRHTIKQRNISIMAWETHQPYANATQSAIYFGVNAKSELYTWYTQKGATFTVDRLFNTVFAGYENRGTGSYNDNTYQLFNSNGNITRQSGNTVGEYSYNMPTQFEVDNNYYVTVDVNSCKFFIDKRTVILDTSANSTQIFENDTFDPTSVIPTYELASIDKNLGIDTEVANAVKNKLSLGEGNSTGATEDYVNVFVYAIILGTSEDNNIIETSNLIIKLSANAVYVVNVAGGDTVLVNVNDGAVFAVIFGQTWTSDLITYQKYKSNFTVTGIEEDAFDDISWDFQIADASLGGIISAGSHQVTFSNIKLMKNNAEVNARVMVGKVNLTVSPAEVVVRPVATAYSKVYGQPESVFNIKYEIVSINGIAFNRTTTYAGYSYQNIEAAISGAFARGLYKANNEYLYLGATYDGATDANGIVLGTTNYYGFAVSNAFVIADDSFSIRADLTSNQRFIIEQKTINLGVNNFVGINKAYDGGVSVNYGNSIAYDISAQLARAQDNLKLSFTAEYTSEGSSIKLTEVGIIFKNLALTGSAANNYKLGTISNPNNKNTLKIGENGENIIGSTDVTNQVVVIIYYIDNNSTEIKINITMGAIALLKEDFTITKRYDNTTKLDASAIYIENRKDDRGGSAWLYQMWRDGKIQITNKPTFGGSDVSARYSISKIELLFPLAGVQKEGISIAKDGIYENPDVEVSIVDGVGIKVVLQFMTASITQRVLTAKDFESITPVNQDYSSRRRITKTDVKLADGALADGDTLENVGINLVSLISGDDFGYGSHTVYFAEIGNGTDLSSVVDSNYSIDINSLNESFNGKVSVFINKAKLYPNVKFKDKYYDGTYDVQFDTASGLQLTTVSYSDALRSELAKFSISGEVLYQLSTNGKLDMNVVVDENHNAIKHNVMISNLCIVEDGNANLLKNYEIYGVRYDSDKKEYKNVGSITNGGTVAAYEMRNQLTVKKKTLEILTNNVIIKEKVYDGTKTADIHVSLEDSGIVSKDLDALFVDAYGTFSRGVVNNNVPVSISGVALQAKEGSEYLLDNYILTPYSERRTANIVYRPVGVTVDLGDKTYNGNTEISKNAMTFNLDGVLANELAGYGVQASGGAYYIDKNVNVEKDKDGKIVDILKKDGVVYNPVLTNTRGLPNYTLAFATNEKRGDEPYIAYIDENGTLRYGETYEGTSTVIYYYALPTTDKYIPATDEENLKLAREAGAIVGNYILNGKSVFTIDSTYSGEGTLELAAPMTYIKGEGRILQKSISISKDAIIANPNSTAFTKMYDGTRKFYGVRGTSIDNGDYYYDNAIGIKGIVEKDNVYIDDILAEFDDAYTTANYVVFTINKISGNDADNYSIYGGIGSERKTGKIVKRTIDAILNNGEMVYGTPLNTIVGDIEYVVHGNVDTNYPLTVWENKFYIPFNQFLEMMGAPLEHYQDALRARLYIANPGGGFDPMDESDDLTGDLTNYYVRLSDITALPTARVEFATSYPSAGDKSISYTLTNVIINNYEYNPVYKKNEKTSELTVVKRDLFVATKDNVINKDYAGTDPEVTLEYYNAEGNRGFAPSETAVSVFRINGVDYYPVVKWIVLNKKTLEWSYMDKYAVISDDLAEKYPDLIYLAHIEPAQTKNGSVDYSTLVKNYNIYLGNGYVVSEDGTITVTYDGFNYTSTATTLMLNQPTMGGVTLRGTSNNTYNETYSGKNLTSTVLLGARDGDEITIEDENGIDLEPVNAGTYVGYIKVKRQVRVDDNDPNSYYNIWTSSDLVTIVIGKASPQLSVVTSSKYYDNVEFVYGVSGVNNMISLLRGLVIRDGKDGDVDIFYDKQVENGFEPVEKLIDAGIYRVTVQLNDNFERNNPNYRAEKAVATFTILRAEVNVTISTEGYKAGTFNSVLSLGTEYEKDKKYAIEYRIDMTDVDPDIVLPKTQTEIVFEKEIVSSGRYPFAVVITDGEFNKNNYRLINANGVLELTTTKVENTSSSVTIVDDSVVANEFVSDEIQGSVCNGSDLELWSKIDEYMPFIDKQAKLSSVVKLGLYYDNVRVELNGTSMDVSVSIPKNVGSLDNKAIYTVTKNGGLAKLENYTVEDGNLQYTTDYLGALVFVDLTPNTMPLWQIIVIAAAAGFVGIVLLWTVIALIIRKSQLKKLI